MEPIPLQSQFLSQARKNEAGTLIVDVAGSISFDDAAVLRGELFKLLDHHTPKRLILNLRQVPYLGSGGIGVFVELLRRLPQNQAVVLTQVQPNVRSVIQIMKLLTLFTVVADDETALGL